MTLNNTLGKSYNIKKFLVQICVYFGGIKLWAHAQVKAEAEAADMNENRIFLLNTAKGTTDNKD